MSMKNSNDNIGNPTSDLPACSAVRVRRKEVEMTKEFRKNKEEKDELDYAGVRWWTEIIKKKSTNQGMERE